MNHYGHKLGIVVSTTPGNDLLRELNGSEWRTLHIDPRDLNALGLLGEALSTMVIYDLRSDPQEVEDFAISAKRNPLTRSHNPIFVGADDEQRYRILFEIKDGKFFSADGAREWIRMTT